MISARLLEVVRCPECAGHVTAPENHLVGGFRCISCGREFSGTDGYLDLRPLEAFAEQTKYLDDALHADARHESVSPPLLGSWIRNDRLRVFLDLRPGERGVDLGCGSGRALVWNADTGAVLTGIDISAFFAREALDECDIVRGDLRRLPLRDAAFAKAWSLDVLEHLSPQALADMLAEANRVLGPGGALFVYTHVRKNGWISGGVRWVNRLAHALERRGWLDLTQERLRKSDHLNPLADYDDLARVAARAGFRIERLTYYTPIIGSFVENVLVRIVEQRLTRRAARAGGPASDAVRTTRAGAKARLKQRGPLYYALRVITAIMTLDVILFGRLRSGPFFALLRKTSTTEAGSSDPARPAELKLRPPGEVR